MKCAIKNVAAALWLVTVLSPAINAQQPETPKKRPPSFTADGPQMPRGQYGSPQSSALGVMKLGEAAEGWARYSLEDTGASLELPGEPQMLRVPVSGETSGSVLRSYFYRGDGVAVFVSYALTPNSGEAGRFVGGWVDGLMKHLGVTDSRIEANRNLRAKRVPVRVTGKIDGIETEFKGTVFFIDEEREVLMVLAQFTQRMAKARAVATRAVDSVEVSN